MRYGGDEFIVITQECQRTDLQELGESIATALADIPTGIGEQPVRASIGAVGCEEYGDNFTVRDVIAEADRLLYGVKSRNPSTLAIHDHFPE